MSEEQNEWEKEREEREFKRWRWETARKFALAMIHIDLPDGNSWVCQRVAVASVEYADALIGELMREEI